MSQEPFAGRAADLIENKVLSQSSLADDDIWRSAAEDCVLARIRSLRILGGLPRHKAPLSDADRVERLKDLLQLWANGCTCAVDEDLFADILNRQPPARFS
ncbi:hypothetical protein [Labrenzia sp. VG12]|uniref:hypothetical protein n=1 Tax=Labrenzia sp. VG12 TaxID=2021862 RepID=UPI000B8C5392|nr:hypothetical protein [Labrenzia sp. VG12]ASP36155.1 hypothetical protein CHH27_25285 [Labrenzia sp. VG12]